MLQLTLNLRGEGRRRLRTGVVNPLLITCTQKVSYCTKKQGRHHRIYHQQLQFGALQGHCVLLSVRSANDHWDEVALLGEEALGRC